MKLRVLTLAVFLFGCLASHAITLSEAVSAMPVRAWNSNDVVLTGQAAGGSNAFTAGLSSVAAFGSLYGLPTNSVDAMRYIAANGIKDAVTKTDIIGAQGEFNAIGQWSNVTDILMLEKRVGASNLLSFKLRPFWTSNTVATEFGAQFFSNAVVQLENLPDSRTNTLVIVWRPLNTYSHGVGWLAGMVNTNNNTGYWYGLWGNDQEKIGYRSAVSNVWSEVPARGNTNLLILDYGWVYNFDARWRWGQRRLTALCVSNNFFRSFDASSAGQSQINFIAPQFGCFADNYITNSLTTLRLGCGTSPVCQQIDGFFGGEIACVFVLKGFADTNLVRAAFRAADWLDRDTKKSKYVSDSRWLFNAPTLVTTNSTAWFLQQRPENYKAANTYQQFSYSGAQTGSWNTQHGFDFLFADGLISKITDSTVYWCLGVNDNYQSGLSGQTSFNTLTNLAYVARTNGYGSVVELEYDISHTNTATFTWTTNSAQRLADYDNLILTNWFLFRGLIRADLLVNQTVLNNTNYFADGVHSAATNGPQVKAAIAKSYLGDNDYGYRPFCSFTSTNYFFNN